MSQTATFLAMRVGNLTLDISSRYDEISISHLDISFRLRLGRAAAPAEEEADE